MRGCCTSPGFMAGWFPFLIRLVLAMVFLHHGYGKVFQNFEPNDKQQAALQELGVASGSGAQDSETKDQGDGEKAASAAKPQLGVYKLAVLLHKKRESGMQWLRWPVALAWLTACTELVGGGLLLIGLLSRVWALGLLIAMGMAAYLVHWGAVGPEWYAGFNIFHENWGITKGGPERALTLAILSLSILVAGPGPFSLDHLLFGSKRKKETGQSDQPAEPQIH